jgi:hypothetical protein
MRTPAAFLLAALALPLAAACGGAPAPQTAENAAAEPAPNQEAAKGKQSLVEVRREFMSSCGARVPGAPDYCECSWEQMQKTMTLEDMNAPEVDKAKLAQFKDRVESTCRSKIPEDKIKAGFIKGCAGDAPKLAPYCDCNWDALRRTFSAAELGDPATAKDPRYTAAMQGAAKTCGAKLSDEAVRESVVRGCTKGDKAMEPFCGCAWKTLRAGASAGDILSGAVDIDAQRPKLEKACAKLRPAK